MENDLDVDGDVLPEWQDERQTGYVFWHTFGSGQSWAQNVDIRRVETPDMAAYLLSEAYSLRAIAEQIGDVSAYELANNISMLERHRTRLWSDTDNRYVYHDRDTNQISHRVTVLEDARADEEQILALKLETPGRLILTVVGGAGKVPRADLYLEGLDADGNTIKETVDVKSFNWIYGQGTYTSSHVYAQIDRIRFEGLSRVYRLNAHTLDLTRLDINAVLPLWSPDMPAERRDALVELITSEAHFSRPSGLTIVSASDPNFDPASARGGGGTWAFWTTLIGEGLLEYGYSAQATQLTKRLLKTQVQVLKQQKHFAEFYHSDEPIGLGENGFLSGIVPLHLLLRVLGVRIMDSGRVWTGGKFEWGSPVTVQHHGVSVYRAENATKITFASGHVVDLPADAEWQEVIDPNPAQTEVHIQGMTPPDLTPPKSAGRVIIQVDHDDE